MRAGEIGKLTNCVVAAENAVNFDLQSASFGGRSGRMRSINVCSPSTPRARLNWVVFWSVASLLAVGGSMSIVAAAVLIQ